MKHPTRLDRFAWLAALGIVAGCAAGSEGRDAAGELQVGVSPDVVISQIYGGGGNTGAQFNNDYVELFNRSAGSVAVDGWSVQYASATGSSWAKANLSGTIRPGGYYLVQLAAGPGGGAGLPSPDATGPMNMSGSQGTVALVTNQSLLACGGSTSCAPITSIHDFVGYGSAAQFEGSSPAPTQSNTTAGFRANHGCSDSNVNGADFSVAAPAPRNASTTAAPCGGGGTVDAGVADAGTTPPDARTNPPDAGSSGDGTPTRRPCTNSFGSAMNTTFGRLDGFLVTILNPGQGTSCSGDAHHVHLQVQTNGAIYNIAVNVDSNTGNPDVDFLSLSAPLKGAPWTEGWHPSQQLDYPTNLGVHSGNFAETTPTQLTSLVDNALANANHISIFTTGFDSTGGHLIHRNGSNHDGAIVINPLSATPQYLLFHFTTQTF
jgi:Lamin Tail Domain